MITLITRPNFYVNVSREAAQPVEVKLERLMNTISLISGYHVEQIKGRTKPSDLVEWRQIFCHEAFNKITPNKSMIGKFLNRDHATIIHSINKVETYIERNDYIFMSKYTKII